jgi:predicted phosphodiesterase
MMSSSKRLSQAYDSAKIIPFDESSKFVIISDCHRGDGTWGDDFSENQTLYYAALSYYYQSGYTYIELGDGDELWENRKMEEIIRAHKEVFLLMSLFYRKGRLHMIYGNHDITKGGSSSKDMHYGSYYSAKIGRTLSLFPGMEITESILLKDKNTPRQIFLTHGHQADFLNDKLWCVSRYLVLYLWHPLETLGIKNPVRVVKNDLQKNVVETNLIQWAKKYKQILIAGHTHRPYYPKKGEPPYFNSGSCVHPRLITAIEIKENTITLVKWSVKTSKDLTLCVGRKELSSSGRLCDFFDYGCAH